MKQIEETIILLRFVDFCTLKLFQNTLVGSGPSLISRSKVLGPLPYSSLVISYSNLSLSPFGIKPK